MTALAIARRLGVNPKSIQDAEAPYLELTFDQLAELRARLIADGMALGDANGLIGWIVAKAHGQADISSKNTRARYRRILADLTRPPKGGNERPPIIYVPAA